jgi:hypothetical protein
VAPGDQGAHAELAGQREGAAIAVPALVEIRRLVPRHELAEEPERVRLVPVLFLLERARVRRLGQPESVLRTACHEAGLSKPGQEGRLHVCQPERVSLLDSAFQQRQRFRDAS